MKTYKEYKEQLMKLEFFSLLAEKKENEENKKKLMNKAGNRYVVVAGSIWLLGVSVAAIISHIFAIKNAPLFAGVTCSLIILNTIYLSIAMRHYKERMDKRSGVTQIKQRIKEWLEENENAMLLYDTINMICNEREYNDPDLDYSMVKMKYNIMKKDYEVIEENVLETLNLITKIEEKNKEIQKSQEYWSWKKEEKKYKEEFQKNYKEKFKKNITEKEMEVELRKML